MTGAGTATVAYTSEDAFLQAPTDPTYYQTGTDVSVTDLSLPRELQRIRDPDDTEAIDAVAQNFEGALGVSWTLTDDNWHSLVFNAGGTSFQPGRPAFSRWWVGIDYLDGTAERVLKGAVVTQLQIQYQQGGVIEISLTLIYAGEELNTAITPTNIEKSAAVKKWHDLDLSVDSVTDVACEKLQSLQLQIDTGARFHRGGDHTPCDAVIGAVETTLTTDAVFTEASKDRLELAYGGIDATSPQESLDAVDATLDIAGTVYSLGGMKPNSHSWNNVVDPESDVQDSTEYYVSTVEVTA